MILRKSLITAGAPEEGDDTSPTSTQPTPPTVSSYAFPVFLVCAICAGFLWWRRSSRRGGIGEGYNRLPTFIAPLAPLQQALDRRLGTGGVRLSTDDLPARHEFLSDNLSSESLPDLPPHSHFSSTIPLTTNTLTDDTIGQVNPTSSSSSSLSSARMKAQLPPPSPTAQRQLAALRSLSSASTSDSIAEQIYGAASLGDGSVSQGYQAYQDDQDDRDHNDFEGNGTDDPLNAGGASSSLDRNGRVDNVQRSIPPDVPPKASKLLGLGIGGGGAGAGAGAKMKASVGGLLGGRRSASSRMNRRVPVEPDDDEFEDEDGEGEGLGLGESESESESGTEGVASDSARRRGGGAFQIGE